MSADPLVGRGQALAVLVVVVLDDQVYERTGGNPLFVRELTRLPLARGGLPDAGSPLPVLLDSVREALQRRLARLSQAWVQMLAAAAVAGSQIRPEVLRQMLASPDELADLLAEAVTARVLIAPQTPVDAYRFSHDLLREHIYASLTQAERTRLHAACGNVLDTLAATGVLVHAAQMAAHFLAAASIGNPEATAAAVAWSRRAAQEAIARLAADDARHYQRALRALDTAAAASQADRADLLIGLADAHNRAGDAPAARSTHQQAAQRARQLADPDTLATAAIGLHSLGAPSGLSHAEPITLLEEAAAALSATDSPRLALVLASLARDLYHSWEHDRRARATARAAQAASLARRQSDPALLARGLLALHDVRWLPGSARQRLTVIDEILDLAAGRRDQELHTQALLLRATARLELGDPRGHHDLTEHCYSVEKSGHPRGRWQAVSRQAAMAGHRPRRTRPAPGRQRRARPQDNHLAHPRRDRPRPAAPSRARPPSRRHDQHRNLVLLHAGCAALTA